MRAALDKVGLLATRKRMPITLSGGEQQRLCIARAMVHRPAILLADEPTGNLDADYARRIGELFRSFNQVGVTVLIATHDQALLARLYAARDRAQRRDGGGNESAGFASTHARSCDVAARRTPLGSVCSTSS